MENNEKWPVTAERYVAFIDIMGFKDLVSRTSHDEVYKMMKKIEDTKNHNANIIWSDGNKEFVRTTTYSDSIMLYSKDNDVKSFYSLLYTVSALTNDLFEEGIPHKGAVAFGTMTLDTEKSIFFGQPLIDAYLLQEELNFYGVILHSSAEKNISLSKASLAFIENYLCPLKNGSSYNLTIYPMYVGEKEGSKNKIRRDKIYDSLNKFRFSTSGHLRRYIDNTKAYFDSVSAK